MAIQLGGKECMKTLFDFFVKLLILSIVLWVAAFIGLDRTQVDVPSVFLAWLLVVVNTVAGYWLFDYAIDKDSQVFTKTVFGGLAVRMLLMMVVVALVIIKDLAVISDFVYSFFAFYVSYMTLEILGYQNKNKQKKNSA